MGVINMSRVYDVHRRGSERSAKSPRVRVTDMNGEIVHGTYRVEFDDDTDEGMATVSKYVTDGKNIVRVNNKTVSETIRMCVRVSPRPDAVIKDPVSV